MQIRVVTYNIHHGKGTDRQLNLDRIANLLGALNADIIGLNEIDRFFSRRSRYMDQVAFLADKLKMNFAFGAAVTFRQKQASMLRQYGSAVLTRHPIVFSKNHSYDRPGIWESRALLETGIELEGEQIRVFTTHLSLNPLSQKQQIYRMLERISDTGEKPVIAMGDWNMKPGSKSWRTITGQLNDVCGLLGLNRKECATFPSFRPGFQLDYIFVSRHFQAVAAGPVRDISLASDHLPLSAELKMLQPNLTEQI
ncbi:endonuclease/exonuclease/phosphatase family protein [Ferviditalea candida]|uniref:Endonuclease/exonuclease/phosphatase family protein n=1 Tax=Ferviditalea candida TaxID=3108399 RepID=A0ABU5ZIG3_9BACL|nr:endonuclease/exonuclease/phosphatase family protein [Paenibacillaceae bacterium T2]